MELLKKFKAKHGHFNVLADENHPLYNWMNTILQRRKLKDDQLQKLLDIGFDVNAEKAALRSREKIIRTKPRPNTSDGSGTIFLALNTTSIAESVASFVGDPEVSSTIAETKDAAALHS